MEKTVDENLVKISFSQIPIPSKLQLGEEVRLLVVGDVTKIEQLDNQDGTINQVYVVKGLFGEVLSDVSEPTEIN